MAVNGKAKGNSFERMIANYLSEQFKDLLGKEKMFQRNSDSGSYFGGKNQNRIQTHAVEHQNFGDILTPDTFNYVVECKSYKEPMSLKMILTQSSKKLDEWISQVEQDAVNADKKPLLIVKYNNVPVFVMVKNDYLDILKFKYKNYNAYDMDEFFNSGDTLPFTFF